jgi:hypothetical protein
MNSLTQKTAIAFPPSLDHKRAPSGHGRSSPTLLALKAAPDGLGRISRLGEKGA